MLRIHWLFCLLALFWGIVVAGCASSGPTATVERFYRAVESGEVKAASEMISGSMVSMMGPKKIKAALQGETAKISRKEGIESIEMLSEKIDGQTAEVRVRVTYGNGETHEENLNLTRIDGRWMITPKRK